MSLDPQRMADDVEARLQAHGEHLRADLASAPPPPGMVAASDKVFAEWMLKQIAADPPRVWLIPVLDAEGKPVLDANGQPATEPVVASGFILMLTQKKLPPSPHAGEPLVDGGEQILRRWERLNAAQPVGGA